MRGKSHICIGKYLIRHYLADIPQARKSAFLFGCIQPDRNPATYLKGSLRAQWLRGHNYSNAWRFMCRISRRLEKKKSLNLFDYYTLGKLIHYTADAFTYAHNDHFPASLSDHREYEIQLQNHFLEYIGQNPEISVASAASIMEGIAAYHHRYRSHHTNVHRDSRYALQACCFVLAILLTPKII